MKPSKYEFKQHRQSLNESFEWFEIGGDVMLHTINGELLKSPDGFPEAIRIRPGWTLTLPSGTVIKNPLRKSSEGRNG